MELSSAATTHRGRLPRRWLQAHGLAPHLLGCLLLVGVGAGISKLMAVSEFLWIPYGILLAYLLLAPRRLWPAYLAAGLLGRLLGAAVAHVPWQSNLVETSFDLLEAVLAAFWLRRRSAQLPNFMQYAYLKRFFAIAVLAVPLVTSLLHALVESLWLHLPFLLNFLSWAGSDSLGVCLATPAVVAIFRGRRSFLRESRQAWKTMLLLAASSVVILSQAKAPLHFLIYPLLILVFLRLGIGWAAMATVFVAIAGGWYTGHGEGPFFAASAHSLLSPTVVLQIFAASAMLMLYAIAMVLENHRSTERNLQKIASLHRLVMENSRDVILVADFEGNRSFVSGAKDGWSGWGDEELKGKRTLDMVHPEDRPGLTALIEALRNGQNDALAEYRIAKPDESYVWVEASLRTIRDPATGAPKSILNSMREITERKLAEQKLAEAYRAVEELAVTDALTGLANRRHFDQYLTTEWRRGMREHTPLSLVIIDADLFKSFNDTYGHLRGDNCLKQIAEAIQDVVSRPGDLVARFGGEEFAVVLPNTDSSGAFQVAQDICAAMRDRQLPHSGNPSGVVTISAGCATLVPQLGQHAPSLIDCADQALYEAKNKGRNRACAFRSAESGSPAIEIDREPAARRFA